MLVEKLSNYEKKVVIGKIQLQVATNNFPGVKKVANFIGIVALIVSGFSILTSVLNFVVLRNNLIEVGLLGEETKTLLANQTLSFVVLVLLGGLGAAFLMNILKAGYIEIAMPHLLMKELKKLTKEQIDSLLKTDGEVDAAEGEQTFTTPANPGEELHLHIASTMLVQAHKIDPNGVKDFLTSMESSLVEKCREILGKK